MKLESEFPVPADPDEVLSRFFDPDTMRGCIPGCEELEKVDDNTYRGRLVNEIAHVRFAAGFSAEIQSVTDTDVKTVKAVLKGEDRKLGSSIKIDAQLHIRPDGERMDASLVGYEMELALWGKLGRLGEPIIRRRSNEVERDFARGLTAVFNPEPPAVAAPTQSSSAQVETRLNAPAEHPPQTGDSTAARATLAAVMLAALVAVIVGVKRSS